MELSTPVMPPHTTQKRTSNDDRKKNLKQFEKKDFLNNQNLKT